MDGTVDGLLGSDDYSDDALLRLLASGKTPSDLSLLMYLSKGFISGHATTFKPTASIVRDLINAGARPFHYGSNPHHEEAALAPLPQPLRSTINVATLIGNTEIVELLINAGEKPNRYTSAYRQDRKY